ncbi:MAG TPA: D-isomer specific 2-hydroxyacid dehydrogenase family protein [Acidimicrobiales bacterium]|nr:D-isomer specific 2-hydroxyacid dehydrogenase family protein [Acidimicrobiales bacterium]
MPAPRVALAPAGVPPWVAEAIVAGGGELVAPAEAEALVWFGPPDPDGLEPVLAEATGASWVQLPWAGIEPYVGLLTPDRTWTCGKGVYAEPVAEHALALGLAGLRGLPQRARATSWGRQGGRTLIDGRVTVVGGGGITEALLALLAPFRCEVTVVRRHPDSVPGAARVLGSEHLDDALPGADLVVLALALTPETAGLVGAAQLDQMEGHAWLVNVARGAHVVTDDLAVALREGRIGGAGIDVTDPEPLPEGHPLWDEPRCIITPHTANTLAMARPHVEARITENVRRFGAGEDLVGLVDLDLGY